MSANLISAINKVNSPYVYLVEMDWNGTTERFWSGLGVLDWQSPKDTQERQWYGAGLLGQITLPPSNSDIEISEMVLTLALVNDDIRSRVNEPIRGGMCRVWMAFLGQDYKVTVEQILREGELDRSEIDDQAGEVRVFVKSDYPFFAIQDGKKWSPEEQKDYLASRGIDPATDTGFDVIHKQQDNTVAWLPPE